MRDTSLLNGKDFVLVWSVRSPSPLPEVVSEEVGELYLKLHSLLGPVGVTRHDPPPQEETAMEAERPLFYCRFRSSLSIRCDGTGTITFYGPGGFGHDVEECIRSASQSVDQFRGSIVVDPPLGIFGPVVGPEGQIEVCGFSYPAVNRADELKVAMAHAIGRIPIDWPNIDKLAEI